jgi:uncharacterized ferritin-like protein (DUF455 family)
MTFKPICSYACDVLNTIDPCEKADMTLAYPAQGWQRDVAAPPFRPQRPKNPILVSPGKVPRRSYGQLKGKIALIHALAHIELNAIDLAWDLMARFPQEEMPEEFYKDWLQVAKDEAKHFKMLEDHLKGWGSFYGDLPAHDGLWEAAEKTNHDLLARLALIPLCFEVRGLDATPYAIERLQENKDFETADLLKIIYQEEIDHVAKGYRWFTFLAEKRILDPEKAYQALLKEYFPGGLKPPFNYEGRNQAGLPVSWYEGCVL